jgi:Chemotaxis protein histidine kinase and related kinases
VLERVSGSFDHLLRNAVAHGIETAEERKAAGKSEVGTLTLSLRQDGNEVVITLADDGRGLNYGAIRAKAERLGLVAPDQPLSEDELTQLVFRPNFSSAESTTAVAAAASALTWCAPKSTRWAVACCSTTSRAPALASPCCCR